MKSFPLLLLLSLLWWGAASAQAPNTLSPEEAAEGWQLLFDGHSTEQWRGYNRESFPEEGWTVEDGALVVLPGGKGGDIITREQFGNFELELEFLLSDSANSGIFYLAVEKPGEPIWFNAPEYQLLDNQTYRSILGEALHTHQTGDNYDLHAASEDFSKPVGSWNQARIVHRDGHVEHWLNGHKVVEYQIGSPDWEERVRNSKFARYPGYGRARVGHIGLQDHNHLVRFRNIKIRRLD